nr:hypothetical protein CFP56_03945 [Quercus suber]
MCQHLGIVRRCSSDTCWPGGRRRKASDAVEVKRKASLLLILLVAYPEQHQPGFLLVQESKKNTASSVLSQKIPRESLAEHLVPYLFSLHALRLISRSQPPPRAPRPCIVDFRTSTPRICCIPSYRKNEPFCHDNTDRLGRWVRACHVGSRSSLLHATLSYVVLSSGKIIEAVPDESSMQQPFIPPVLEGISSGPEVSHCLTRMSGGDHGGDGSTDGYAVGAAEFDNQELIMEGDYLYVSNESNLLWRSLPTGTPAPSFNDNSARLLAQQSWSPLVHQHEGHELQHQQSLAHTQQEQQQQQEQDELSWMENGSSFQDCSFQPSSLVQSGSDPPMSELGHVPQHVASEPLITAITGEADLQATNSLYSIASQNLFIAQPFGNDAAVPQLPHPQYSGHPQQQSNALQKCACQTSIPVVLALGCPDMVGMNCCHAHVGPGGGLQQGSFTQNTHAEPAPTSFAVDHYQYRPISGSPGTEPYIETAQFPPQGSDLVPPTTGSLENAAHLTDNRGVGKQALVHTIPHNEQPQSSTQSESLWSVPNAIIEVPIAIDRINRAFIAGQTDRWDLVSQGLERLFVAKFYIYHHDCPPALEALVVLQQAKAARVIDTWRFHVGMYRLLYCTKTVTNFVVNLIVLMPASYKTTPNMSEMNLEIGNQVEHELTAYCPIDEDTGGRNPSAEEHAARELIKLMIGDVHAFKVPEFSSR